MRRLDIYLHGQLVGELIQTDHGQLAFRYAASWLTSPAAVPLSLSLPLRKERFSRNECHGYFAGILPEQSQRDLIAKNLGISARNDFALLEKIGGECAGAVTFLPAGHAPPSGLYEYRSVSTAELVQILEGLPRRPLLAGEQGIRLSLAGAQNKIAVHVSGQQISLPLGGAPSTHILKPAIDRFAEIVSNEAFCMKLATAIDLNVASVAIGTAGHIEYLLVERFDRKSSGLPFPNYLERIHQEDFCQALGISPEYKYQIEGGPSIKDCVSLIRRHSSAPVIDLQQLIDAVIFNVLIGNHDAHGKNFSLLLYGNDIRLAPFYDLLSTALYPELSANLAMKIGGEYQSANLRPVHFDRMAQEAGLAAPLVRRRVIEVAEAVLVNIPKTLSEIPTAEPVARVVQERCRAFRQHSP